MKNINSETSAGAVIYRKEKENFLFLLVYSKRNEEWGFPKGHIEDGETDIEAAQRETEEETGIKIDIKNFVKDFCFKDTYKIKGTLPETKGRIIDKNVIYYLACYAENESGIKPNANNSGGEISKIQWMTFEQAVECLKYDKQKEVLKTVKQFLRKYRSIDV